MTKTIHGRSVLAALAFIFVAVASTGYAQPATTTTTTTSTTATTNTATTDAPAATTEAQASQSFVTEPWRTDRGWNTRWSMLFSLSNIFAVGNFLSSPVEGSLGATVYLSPKTGIRMGLSLGRASSPLTVTKTVTSLGTINSTVYVLNNAATAGDAYVVNARADYLYRLLERPLSPYFGGGLSVGWMLNKTRFTDSQTTTDHVLSVDNNSSGWNVTARAVAGAEWRFNSSFAIFADYNLAVGIYTNARISNSASDHNNVTNTTASVTSTSDTSSWLNIGTGLSQGATLGLELFF